MLPDDEQIAEIANRDIAPAICPLCNQKQTLNK
jgi:Zn ribbon nucleic-acid-binding protein